jgi:cell division protein FtsN
MVDRDVESGRELVLDNRKLLGIFVVFIGICGVFFILGFKEGKRQGIQQGEQTATEIARKAYDAGAREPVSKAPAADVNVAPPTEAAEGQQLDWYQNVNRKDGAPAVVHPTTAEKTAGDVKNAERAAKTMKTTETEPAQAPSKKPVTETLITSKPQKQADALPSNTALYSVQVGAFRMKSEAENKANELRARNYECRIENPQSSDGFYLLKAGKFKTKAEAVAMRLRLQKSGIFSIIKTN